MYEIWQQLVTPQNFFMPIIAKGQPLHRPSMQSPPTIAAFLYFDIIADIRSILNTHAFCDAHNIQWHMHTYINRYELRGLREFFKIN